MGWDGLVNLKRPAHGGQGMDAWFGRGGWRGRRTTAYICIHTSTSEHGVYGMDWIWRCKEAANEI